MGSSDRRTNSTSRSGGASPHRPATVSTTETASSKTKTAPAGHRGGDMPSTERRPGGASTTIRSIRPRSGDGDWPMVVILTRAEPAGWTCPYDRLHAPEAGVAMTAHPVGGPADDRLDEIHGAPDERRHLLAGR